MRTSSDAFNFSRVFYQFLGVHSFLIGLFPFFAPVILWDKQYSLSDISFFIAFSAFGFCLALSIWDRLTKRITLFYVIVISFVLEISMIISISVPYTTTMLMSFSLLYGIYNCFFWTTQRAIFFETINDNDSGRRYGNFQIFVAIVLQIGILIGGLLLEKSSLLYIYILSMLVSVVSIIYFYYQRQNIRFPRKLINHPALSFNDVVKYKDNYNTRTIFMIDGLYLFLESFFWLISLFLLAHKSFWKLGVMIIVLSAIFLLLFVILKNTIDHIATYTMYKVATVLYALSWLLRGFVTKDLALEWLFVMLVTITFCTSFFRLAFNKRFYDLAKITTKHRYLIHKSYYSQFFIAIIYLMLGFIFINSTNIFMQLQWVYWLSAPLALIYLFYGRTYFKSLAIPG